MMKVTHEKAISTISSFYKIITKHPYIDPAALVFPPGSNGETPNDSTNDGWPNINTKELRERGKTEEVITFLRHLPYLRHPKSEAKGSGKRWMMAPDTIAIAYCDGEVYSDELDKIQPTPPHCIWLADAANTENGVALLLDMENSTITEYSVRSDRTIGLSPSDYKSLPLEDRWMAHFTWPIGKLFDTWTQNYENLGWIPAYHDKGTAGTAMWFISPQRCKNGFDDDDDDQDSENYEPGSTDPDYESEDDYDSDEDDPYEWDSEYDSEDDYEVSDEEGAPSEGFSAGDHQPTSDALMWLKHDVKCEIRLSDDKTLDSNKVDLNPEEVVKDAYTIYKDDGWPDRFDRERCQRQLSELAELVVLSSGKRQIF